MFAVNSLEQGLTKNDYKSLAAGSPAHAGSGGHVRLSCMLFRSYWVGGGCGLQEYVSTVEFNFGDRASADWLSKIAAKRPFSWREEPKWSSSASATQVVPELATDKENHY